MDPLGAATRCKVEMVNADTRVRRVSGAVYKGRDRCRRWESASSASTYSRQSEQELIWLRNSSSSGSVRALSRYSKVLAPYSSHGFIQRSFALRFWGQRRNLQRSRVGRISSLRWNTSANEIFLTRSELTSRKRLLANLFILLDKSLSGVRPQRRTSCCGVTPAFPLWRQNQPCGRKQVAKPGTRSCQARHDGPYRTSQKGRDLLVG